MSTISNPRKIDGKKIAQRIKDELKEKIVKLSEKPGLGVILVGDDSASQTYVNLKKKACEEIGMYFEKHCFEKKEKKEKILEALHSLNKNPKIHGIIIQLPLPSHLPTQEIIDAMDPQKDADGFHPKNTLVKPVLVEVILEIFKETKEKTEKKILAIIGNSSAFLDPLKKIFTPIFQKVLVFNNSSILPSMEEMLQFDDIIIALGKPHFLKSKYIKKNTGLIDIGVSFVDEKICGDIDPACYEKAKWYTPVPGGVGPITVAKLLENVYKLFIASTEK